MRIGNREFDTANHTYVMGILNVTPDSFSDGGSWITMDKALYRVEEMLNEGVDIVDIGGESTRPGAIPLPEKEELVRVIPVIEAIKARFDVPISLDTYKGSVAAEGILAGADMINDIWGLQYDARMAEVIAKSEVAYCMMHNRKNAEYQELISEVLQDLESSLALAKKAGIPYERICLDPGVGFAKNYEQNLEVIQRLDAFHTFGLPILLGVSRKSVIGQTLGLPVKERLEGTLVTTVYGVLKGVSFVRVHDIKENVRAIRMTEAIKNI